MAQPIRSGRALWGRLQPANRCSSWARLQHADNRGAELAGETACPTDWRARLRGFTFVELMVVITIIVILISMAIPIYNNTIRRSKESVLKNNLFTLRTVIDNYTYDKQKAPQSLQDLVTAGYLRAIPIDPMTGGIRLAHHHGGCVPGGGPVRPRYF